MVDLLAALVDRGCLHILFRVLANLDSWDLQVKYKYKYKYKYNSSSTSLPTSTPGISRSRSLSLHGSHGKMD